MKNHLIFALFIGLAILSCKDDKSRTKEQSAWNKLLETPSVQAIEDFMEKYPDGVHYDAAHDMYVDAKEENNVWEEAVESHVSEVYAKYINKYPKGLYTKKAIIIHDSLLWNETKRYGDLYAYEYYLQHAKTAIHSVEARKILEEIRKKSDAERLKLEIEARTMREAIEDERRRIPIENASADAKQNAEVNENPSITQSSGIDEIDDNQIYETPEVMASYPGGDEALYQWLYSHIKYPSRAQEQGIQGRVMVRFVVEKDGSIGNVQITRTPDEDLSNEAKRVIKIMPKWTPARQGRSTVRSHFNLPIMFRLN